MKGKASQDELANLIDADDFHDPRENNLWQSLGREFGGSETSARIADKASDQVVLRNSNLRAAGPGAGRC